MFQTVVFVRRKNHYSRKIILWVTIEKGVDEAEMNVNERHCLLTY